jgi:hypothetical protein
VPNSDNAIRRQNFSYFSESTGYYDNDFKWHVACDYDYDYGLPLGEPVAVRKVVNASSGAMGYVVVYSRTYSRCVVTVACNTTTCLERGPDLKHNCCNVTVHNTSTGLTV